MLGSEQEEMLRHIWPLKPFYGRVVASENTNAVLTGRDSNGDSSTVTAALWQRQQQYGDKSIVETKTGAVVRVPRE